jgi:hypothetical protein
MIFIIEYDNFVKYLVSKVHVLWLDKLCDCITKSIIMFNIDYVCSTL